MNNFEPYRLFFPLALFLFIINMGLWGGQFAPLNLTPHISTSSHIHLMIFGFSGFIWGFIFTAYPKFLGVSGLSSFEIKWGAITLGFVQILLVVSFYWMKSIIGLAKILEICFWVWSIFRLLQMKVRARKEQLDFGVLYFQEWYVILALSFALLILILDKINLYPRLIAPLAIYPFICFLCMVVIYRVLPFFISKAVDGYEIRRGKYFLHALIILLSLKAFIIHPLLDLLIFLHLSFECWRWRIHQGLSNPLIFFHLTALFWIVIFFLSETLPLNFPLLHLLFINGFILLIYSISLRVSLGHGGHPLKVNYVDWLVVTLIHLLGLIRVATSHYAYAALLLVFIMLLWFGRISQLNLQKLLK